MQTGQWFTSAQGTRWWFDSGSPSLAFGYTGGFGDNPAWEQLSDAGALGGWLHEHYQQVEPQASERDLADALTLRGAIVRAALAVADARPIPSGDIDLINLYAATPDLPPRLEGGGRQAGAGRARPAMALSSLARDAVALFSEHGAERIHECSADDCTLVFFDDSRSGNRRWCSMQRCGNRAKVRAHRARSAQTAG